MYNFVDKIYKKNDNVEKLSQVLILFSWRNLQLFQSISRIFRAE